LPSCCPLAVARKEGLSKRREEDESKEGENKGTQKIRVQEKRKIELKRRREEKTTNAKKREGKQRKRAKNMRNEKYATIKNNSGQ
jgi:hypothetical protein